MFTIDTDIKDLNVRERNMMKAFFSMNNHQVATPEMMSEEARSYVIFFQRSRGENVRLHRNSPFSYGKKTVLFPYFKSLP